MKQHHIIDVVFGWREQDYDGYNDFYVNPEFTHRDLPPKHIDKLRDKSLETIEIKLEERTC